MEYKFNVSLSEDDYLEYNRFWNFKSPYGKKQMLNVRVMVAAIFVIAIVWLLIDSGLSFSFYVTAPIIVLALIIYELLLPKIAIRGLKKSLEKFKKLGKLPYSSETVMEFYGDNFLEITENSTTQCLYSNVERLSINADKAIYLHTNSLSAYILPRAVFETQVQYDEFLEFIKSKNIEITHY